MIRADYSKLRPYKQRVVSRKTRKGIGGTLLLSGVVLLYVFSGETDTNVSIFWNLGFGIAGAACSVLGMKMLGMLSKS